MEAPQNNIIPILRTIEMNTSELERRLKTLKKPEGKDHRLSYDEKTQSFAPIGYFSWGSSANNPVGVLNGLENLNHVAKETFKLIRELHANHANARDTLEARKALRNRYFSILNVLDGQTKPCIDAMKEAFRPFCDEKVGQEFTNRAAQISGCFELAFDILDSSLNMSASQMRRALQPEDLSDFDLKGKKVPKSVQETVDTLMNDPAGRRQLMRSVDFHKDYFLVIPEELVKQHRAELKAMKDNLPPKRILKEEILDRNNQLRQFDNCPPLKTSQERTEWVPYQIFEGVQIRPNATTPTSQRTNDRENHLVNFRAQFDEVDGHISITCGVINTLRKANEFIQGVENVLRTRSKENPPIKLRLVLHQLNSFYGETPFIEEQNKFSRIIEDQFRNKLKDPQYCNDMHLVPNTDEPCLAHFNLAMNRASSLGYTEDSWSHTMNLEAFMSECIWLIKDNSERRTFEYMKAELPSLMKLRDDLMNAKHRVSFVSNKYDQRVVDLQNQMNDALFSLIGQFNSLLTAPLQEYSYAEMRSLKTRIRLLTKAIEMQVLGPKKWLNLFGRPLAVTDLGHTPMDRIEELETHLLNDMAANATTEMNCKSGSDRTGLARAVWDALRHMYSFYVMASRHQIRDNVSLANALAFERLENLVAKQNKLIPELDIIIAQVIAENKINYAIDINQLDGLPGVQGDFSYLFQAKLGSLHSPNSDKYKELMDAFNYQNLVCVNIFKVAQVVTMENTGVPGMKWGKNYGATDLGCNPIPPKRMPRFVLVGDKVLQLTYPTNNLTPAGVQMLVRWGNLRGE